MQRGDIKGPPYVMPDNIELSFLRKFIERQAANIPHNPRLRNPLLENRYNAPAPRLLPPPPSESPEPSDDSVLDGASSDDAWDGDRRHPTPGQLSRVLHASFGPNSSITERSVPRYSGPVSTVSYVAPIKSSPRLATIRSLEEDAESSSTPDVSSLHFP
jgi:hypothetical protein